MINGHQEVEALIRREAALNVNKAFHSTEVVPFSEVISLLEINPEEDQAVIFEQLFNVALHPSVQVLPEQKKLAVIKTAQIMIGHAFTEAWKMIFLDD